LGRSFRLAKEIALIATSSAAVERLFSLLSMGFDDSQDRALEDMKAASCLLRYNVAKMLLLSLVSGV
jgi:hypothetical protein